MKALLLEAPKTLVVRDLPDPECGAHEVLVRVEAVGICGTDFHIWSGHGNYNTDANGRAIPLSVQPQILGHEFVGTVVETGSAVEHVKPGERLAIDQGLNCYSLRFDPPCEYCQSGDSHQCLHYRERGITGHPGAMQEFLTMPAVNTVPLPDHLSFEEAVLSEPLGCIIHAMDKACRAGGRYVFGVPPPGARSIEQVLILGAGPAGLLFLQYLRNVLDFQGQLLVADPVETKLALVEELGGTPIRVGTVDLAQEVRRLTQNEKIHFLIEACGRGSAFEAIPTVLKKQGTVLLYGHGHAGTDLSVLGRVLFLEPTLIAPVGASGLLDPVSHRPLTYQRAVSLIGSGRIRARALLTHRYEAFEEIEQAFREDHRRPDYIKGILRLKS